MKNGINETVSLDQYTEDVFELLVSGKIDGFLKEFDKASDIHTDPHGFAEEEYNRMNQALSDLHNSNPKLNKFFFEVHKIKRSQKDLTYSSVIKSYCEETKIDRKSLFEFAADLIALYKILELIRSKAFSLQEFIKNESVEKNESDYTLSRKVLTLYFLMNDFFQSDSIPDKTTIARFIDSIIHKTIAQKIANTNTYEKVKSLFFNPAEANTNDLLYVKNKFLKLGLLPLVKSVETTLSEKNQKNQ
jgi:hypothetical protein